MVDGVPREYLDASHKSLPVEQWPAFDAQVRGVYKHMGRISVMPTSAKVLDFETRLPVAVERLVRNVVAELMLRDLSPTVVRRSR